ncbi:hypothetical protein [Pseudoxanthomonas putridarboris]|uniref:Uncharacterized protein n=1 Tax=Pseudoxanthomonas putridarboris TaxID=752605 RepID=A0ABU9J424_9GAMM
MVRLPEFAQTLPHRTRITMTCADGMAPLSRDSLPPTASGSTKPLFSCGFAHIRAMRRLVFFWSREQHPVLRAHMDLRRRPAL